MERLAAARAITLCVVFAALIWCLLALLVWLATELM